MNSVSFTAGPFGVVAEMFLLRAGSFVIGVQLGYEVVMAADATLHGPLVALALGMTTGCDGAGIPRGPRMATLLISAPLFAAYGAGADEPSLLFGFEFSGARGF